MAPYLTLSNTAAGGPASVDAAKPAVHPAMEDAFREWYSRNSYSLEDGGCGDVESLFIALCASAQKD
jgi:hypothetical protein